MTRLLHIAGAKNVYNILNQTQRFIAPYHQRIGQLGEGARFFQGSAHISCDSAQRELLELINAKDLEERIPALVAQTVSVEQNVHWGACAQSILTAVVEDYFGLPMSQELLADTQRLNDWLFTPSPTPLCDLAEPRQQSIRQSKQRISCALEQALQNALAANDSASASVVARAAVLAESSYSQSVLVDVLTGLLLALCPQLDEALRSFAPRCFSKRLTLNKIYQAASAGDCRGLASMLTHRHELRRLFTPPAVSRLATEDVVVKRKWLTDIKISAGDEIVLRLEHLKLRGKQIPKSLRYNPQAPAENFLKNGFEAQTTFGLALTATVLSASFVRLFAGHRIGQFSAEKLELSALPSSPESYRFDIMGSSPPWAVAEEQAWLLDSCGLKYHQQFNILSFYEFFRLLFDKVFGFYDSSTFYCAYDRNHQVVFGSSFSGAGMQTVKMGEGFQHFASILSSSALQPANQYSNSESYDTVFKAYSIIRENYYTWAYFTAFLDKGYGFIVKALLIFKRHPRFKALTPIGNGLLLLVIGLVALIQKLPYLGTRLNNLFASVVAKNSVSIHAGIASIDAILADGRPYIFGERFTAGDIHLCANLVNLIVPDEFQGGGVLPPLDQYPPNYKSVVNQLRQTLTGQYVLRVYREHRVPRT